MNEYHETPPIKAIDQRQIDELVCAWVEMIGLRGTISAALRYSQEVEDDNEKKEYINQLLFGLSQVNHSIDDINLTLSYPRQY